ncbi:hypothetical protein [Micromonospora sp. CPCC 205561]|uniref:hypothetical protein n=1 Tax=Micromonospora sp. CPCC 205561 TaxID=3122407 RepID=UPI002FF351A2
MSGRKLGRLRGSLLVLAAAALVGLFDASGALGTEDLIWTSGDLIWTAGDLIWTVRPEDALAGGGR